MHAPVAARLAGGGVLEIATAGKPDCYKGGMGVSVDSNVVLFKERHERLFIQHFQA